MSINNDNFADRRDLGSGTSADDTTGTNRGFTSEPGEPSQSGEINSAWWSWTPAQTGWVVINISNKENYRDFYVSVFTGNAVDNLTRVNKSARYTDFFAIAGTEYQIAIDGLYYSYAKFNKNYSGDFKLYLRQDLSFVANDNFADRRNLGSGTSATDTGSNIGFTSESGEPSQSGAINSAWWSWTPAQTGWVVIDINKYHSNNSDYYVSVFTGDAVDNLTLVNQNKSGIGFWAMAETEYQIAVDGYDHDTGDISINLDQDLSFIPNDNFADRRDLGSGTSANDTGTNRGFTSEPGEPSQSGTINSAWWSWTPAETGWVVLYIPDGYVSVFTGDAVDNLTLVNQKVDQMGFWATVGTEYQIAVDGSVTRTGDISINLEQDLSFIPNDNFADRRDLGSGTSAFDTSNNVYFTSEPGEPSQSQVTHSAWWSWTPVETGLVIIDTYKSSRYVSVFTGDAVDNLTLVNQNLQNISFWATAGMEYQIAVDGYNVSTGDISINLEQDLGFAFNDNFADRRDLGSGTSANDTGTNASFTSEPGEPSQSGEINSAWWSWTPAQTGWVVIDTYSSRRYVSAFTGDAVDNLTLVNQNLQNISFWATAGTEYQIAVDGYNVSTGDISINLEQDLGFAFNDNFADRRDLGSGSSATDTIIINSVFTSELGEPSQSGEINSAWWSWTPAQTGWVVIDAEEDRSRGWVPYLSVFTGNTVDSLTLVNRGDISTGFSATAGTEYQIAVDGRYDYTGVAKLNLEQDFSFVSNDNFADRRDLGSGNSVTDTGSNLYFTSEPGEPLQSGEINSAWWSWTPAETGWVFVEANHGRYVSVFTGSTVDSLTTISSGINEYYGQNGFWATAGTEYQIAVDSSGHSYTGWIELNLEQDFSFVPHDNFADRRDLGSGNSAFDTSSNVGFTSESGEPSQSGEINSAWWSWTPAETGWVIIDALDNRLYLSVFTGNTLDSLIPVNQNLRNTGFWAKAGREYQIAVDGDSDYTGKIILDLEQNFAPNDNFADRRDLASEASVHDTGSNVGFTSESGEPSQSGEINSAWWSWTAPETGWVVIDARHSSHYVSVFTGNAVDNLTLVNQNRRGVDFWAETGTEYQIAVDDRYQNEAGKIYLNLDYMISLIWQKDDTGNFIMSYLDKGKSYLTIDPHIAPKEYFLLNRQNELVSLNDNWNVYQANLMGTNQTDLLLQNKISGKFQIWELEGNKIVGNHSVTNASTNKQPQINDNWDVLTGNFTGTNQDDILLKNKVVGTFSLWEMVDNFIVGTHTITRNGKAVQLKNNHNWDLIVGNFVGSEHDDILLRNKISGNLQVWEIHDKEIIASHKIMNPLSNRQISLNQNWQIFSTKFGSGVRDNILLRNKISGGLQVWDMDGNQLVDITHLTDLNYSDSSLVI